MKNIFTIILLFITTLAFAQIPNGSFETWVNGAPQYWWVSNEDNFNQYHQFVSQSSLAHQGSSAAQLNNVEEQGRQLAALLVFNYNTNGTCLVLNSQPGAVYGWYTGEFIGGDFLSIQASTKTAAGSISSQANGGAFTSDSVYKMFYANFAHGAVTFGGADSLTIYISIDNISGYVTGGTQITVDDITLGPAVTAVQTLAENALLETCTPNPASNVANIIYSLAGNSTVNLALYDITGNRVKNLLVNAQQTNGRYKVPVDVSNLPAGIYLYTLLVDGQPYSQKLTVAN